MNNKAKKPVKFILHTEHNLKLTESCIKKINQLQNPIRIIINGGGCQGFQYEFVNDEVMNVGEKTRDIVLIDENNQPLIIFDIFSEFYIAGSEIDYISNLLESGFKINNNPKAKSSCGCKKSFSSDEFFEEELYDK